MAKLERFETPLRRALPARWRRFGSRVARRFDMPWHPGWPEEVQIVPSNACNFRCKACPKFAYETDNRILPRRVYERVREQILPYVRRVNLQGLGEPMMSPLFMPMLRDARDGGLEIVFVTNASYLNEESVAEIAAAPVVMTISIDGASAAVHTDSRPEANFDQLLGALALVKRAMADGRTHPRFSWCANIVVTKRNLSEIEGVLELAAGHGAVNLTLIAPGMGPRTDDFANDAIGQHPELLRERYPAIRRRAEELKIGLIAPEFAKEALPGTASADAPKPSRLFPGRCEDAWRTVFVDVDGWVRPCCVAEHIGMGNIMEQDFRTIWNNEHYRRLRKHLNSPNPPSFCRTCVAHWGINGGDEHHVRKLAERGVQLPDPPSIGVVWDKEQKKVVPAT